MKKTNTSTGYMPSGTYKGIPMKNVPYWSQPGNIKKAPDYVNPNSKVKSKTKSVPKQKSNYKPIKGKLA
jgi:hypothetical protein